MRKWCSALTSAMLALALLPSSAADAATDKTSNKVEPAKQEQTVESPSDSAVDELVIKYKEGSDLTQVAGKHKGKIDKVGKQVGKLKAGIVKLPKGADKKAIIEELKADPAVEYVQPNYVYQTASAPNDPYYGEQWNLKRINAEKAWEVTTGSPSVAVAVIDTGVKRDPDLMNSLLPGFNAIDGSSNIVDDSNNLHGTRVAGTIAASANNSYQIAGVAPTSKILPVKVMGANGRGYDIDIAEGIVWAVDHGAKILNLSFASYNYSQVVSDAISYARMKGVLVIAAGGNDADSVSTGYLPRFPADGFNVFAVGATDATNKRATFSNRASWIKMVAPGTNIRTTDGGVVNGTSFAAAQVSGAAALLLSKNPTLTPDEIETILMETAVDIGWDSVDDDTGYGLLDVGSAVNASWSPDLMLIDDGPDPLVPGQSVNEIRYYAFRIVNETVKIYDSENRLVKTLTEVIDDWGSVWASGLHNKFKWDGTNDANVPVPKGTYRYVLQGTHSDTGRPTAALTGTITVADDVLPTVGKAAVSLNPFAANGQNSTELSYELNKESQVTVNIYNGSTLVRKLTDVKQAAGRQQMAWNGRNDAGQLLPAGAYTYEIRAKDSLGKEAPVVTGSITLNHDAQYPVFSALSDSPERVTDKSMINYTVSTSAAVSVEIYDRAMKRVRTLSDRQQQTAGAHQILWDGTNDAGALLADQEYSYKIYAVDAAGGIRNEVWGSITLDKSQPEITNISLNDTALQVGGSNVLTVEYELSEIMDSTVTIETLAGETVATLTTQPLTDTTHKATWTGRNSAGVLMPHDTYYYVKITATDQSGEQAVPVKMPVQVLNWLLSGVSVKNDVSGSLPIYYTLAEPASVSIKIFDSAGVLVRTVLDNVSKTSGSQMATWDRRSSTGGALADGTYTYKVTATPVTGQPMEKSGTIKLDSTGPKLEYVGVQSNYLDTSKGLPFKLAYRMTEAGVTSAFIKSINKTLVISRSVAAGETVEVYWDGTDGDGKKVAPGNYSIEISTTDTAGANPSMNSTLPVYVDFRKDAITNLTDGPDPFTPNGTNFSSIKFALYAQSVLSVELFDKQGQLVRTLRKNTTMPVSNQVINWDGKDNAGVLVTDGTYTYKVSGSSAGVPLETLSGTITVDTLPLLINDSFTPNPFVATVAPATLGYTLKRDAKVTAEIYTGGSNTLVKTLESNVSKKAGTYNLTWDGKDNSAVLVPSSTYTYRITSTDAAGVTAVKTGQIQVIPQLITRVQGLSGTLKLSETTKSTVYFNVVENTKVNLKIYDKNNVPVRTILSLAPYSPGTQVLAFDGRNDAGLLLEDGTYTYKFSTVNSAGIESLQTSGTFQTDKNAPVVSNLAATPNPFAPGGTNKMSIGYSLDEAAKVTLNIYNSSNVLVKTLVSAAPNQAGANSVTWDGKDSAGAIVPAGSYSYRMLATDAVGFSRSLSGVFKVGVPLVISDVRDINDPLKVTGTNASTIYYTLSQAGNVTIKVYDSNNTLVSTVLSNSAQTAGAKAAAWYGKNDAGLLVEDGTYTYKINAVNAQGQAAVEVTGTITTDKNAPIVSNLTATPNPFNPTTAELTVNYNLNESAKVTVGIYNASGTLVRTLTSAVAVNAGTNTVKWDGKDTGGAVVPDGAYTVRILATDSVGLSRNAQGAFKVEAAIAPVISSVRDINDPLKVTGTTASTIYYTLSEASNVTISVYDSNNVLVNTLLDNSAQSAGSKAAAWYGKNDAGLFVEDGTYTYKIHAVNALGLAAVEATGTITTDKNAPAVTEIAATPNPFSPARDGNLSIKYTLNEAAKVTVSIYNASNVLIRTVTSAAPNTAGANTVAWDGKDNAGNVVPNGAYSYRILATDLVGLSRSVSGVVKVETL